jgi:hypothetical protein
MQARWREVPPIPSARVGNSSVESVVKGLAHDVERGIFTCPEFEGEGPLMEEHG